MSSRLVRLRRACPEPAGEAPARLDGQRRKVVLVDLSGETNIRYVPLACLCLKANVRLDPRLDHLVDVELLAFTQANTSAEIVTRVIAARPDVVAMSVQGWNQRQLAATFSPIKQFCPDTLLVVGGNHVSDRAETLLGAHPSVDVVVNGEGESTFNDLLSAHLCQGPLSSVPGISFRTDAGVVTTEARPRSKSILDFPSPYSLDDVDYRQFDVALLETNRGCPYACAFCYWGGRVGQKLAKGALDRVRGEVEVIAKAGIRTLFLCDANFGILRDDVEIARIIVEAFRKYGAPAAVNVNWAKNHAARVEEIIRTLDGGGIETEVNVPLQTLSKRALSLAGRDERGRAEMVALARKLASEGRRLHCELIYGLPGESIEEFRENYDRLYLEFPILRIHPLWLLPNTDYERRRRELEIKTLSPDPSSDYEAVVAHLNLGLDEMRDGLALLLSHSILSLLGSATTTLRLLARAEGRSTAKTLADFEGFVDRDDSDLARGLRQLYSRIRRACYFERELRAQKRELLYASRERTFGLVARFLSSLKISEGILSNASYMLAFDSAQLPRSELSGSGMERSDMVFPFDPVELRAALMRPSEDWSKVLRAPQTTRVTFQHRSGLAILSGRNCDLTGSWNGKVVGADPLVQAQVPQARLLLQGGAQ